MNYAQFEVLVGMDSDSPDKAIADASKYLAYGDQSNVFGEATVLATELVEYLSEWEEGVAITFGYNFASDEQMAEFMEQMRHLSHVVSVERVD